MADIERAANVQATIRGYAGANPNGLTRVPVERVGSREDADRVLQVQIFALADAVADLAKAVQELSARRR